MGNCCSKPSGSPVILSPPHDGSNPSLPPPVESSPLCARDSGSPPPPPPPMEASLPPPVPSGLPSPFMDSIEDLKGMCDKIDLVGQIDLLISFIENQILNMKTPSGARPSSSEGWLGTILDGTKLAAKTVDFISTEAERLSESDVVKGLGNLTLNVMKGIGQLHWVFVGLSVAAFAVESHMKIGSTQNECNDLLLKILELAKTVGKFKQVMPDELETREKMCNAVATIVEGAVICVAYLKKGYLSRFLSTSTAAAQLDKANKQLNDARDSLGLAATFQILRQATRLPDQSSVSPLLEIQPVGIEEQVKEVKALLDMEGVEPALAVIVCGFGGLGKSTLAASVVDSLDLSSTEFNFCRVAINESTPDKTSHIIHLQKFIINKLEGVKYDFQSPEEGRHRIKEAVKNKCSLLFIDNVVDKDYVRDLLPRDWSSSEEKTKLRILITSREKNVKAELKINCKEYDVKALSEEASKHLLFETIVEDNVEEDRDFDERGMINQVAAACKGVPILLSVFGKHLRVARNEDNYQEELNEALKVLREGNLNTFREEYLGSKLMFVYDKIQDVEVKEAFLDICSYFQGWKWSIVADIVDILKLEDLRKRMLVSKSDSGEVIVHDILQLMGMKEARLTRFSNYKELSDNLDGSEKVKGISLVNDNSLIIIQSTQLDDMAQSLRVLMLGDWVKIDEPPCHKTFKNLRYLRVGDINAFPFKDPSKLNELRVFVNRSKCGMNLSHLPSSLRRISHEVPHADCDKFAKLPFENLRFLKSFTVKTRKSVELPEELHLPASLVYLNLSRCKNLPKDIGHLTALQSLILDRTDMQCLLQGFGKLQKLQHLSMDYCSKLAFLSEEFGMLSSLKALSMEECVNLTALPDRLEGLHSLQTLELTGSINLELLPESFGELRLRSLKLERLEKLKELPNSFGNMALLENLSLTSCKSLMSLPSSFVQLKMLQTLELYSCTKLSALPEYFGRLRVLKHMEVSHCTDLKELPYGFGALPDLKVFSLYAVYSFVNLPKDFTELTSLEELRLSDLPLISRFPDGFGKLKNLRFLNVQKCFQLKTLSDDFENLATLEQLAIQRCPELDGAMMEKILKLQQCYFAEINGSSELLKKWKHMKSETEYPVEVRESYLKPDYDAGRERAIRVGLLQGKCMEVNNTTHQLMERPSLLAVFEKGTKVTVALIMLPIHFQFQSHHQQTLRRFVDMARETATSNGSDKLQIVCARQCLLGSGKRPTPTEAEEEDKVIPQILLSLPEGSCAIPSSESKRLNLLSSCLKIRYNANHVFFMANEGLDIDGRKTFENLKFEKQDEFPGNVVMEPAPSEIWEPEDNTILNFIKSIHPHFQGYSRADGHSESQDVAGESKTREFIKVLKDNGIDYLVAGDDKIEVDDLQTKTIGFIICDLYLLEYIKTRQIYKDLQQKDSNFIGVWIPPLLPEGFGHDSYTRLIQCMPWATFPQAAFTKFIQSPQIFPCFVVLGKDGQIANNDAFDLVLGWGAKTYPFTEHSITQSFSLMESESCLEFLLHGMNIVGRKPMKKKMTFLSVVSPNKLEQLPHINGNFELLHVGRFARLDLVMIPQLKQDYEDMLGEYNGRWPSLAFWDMVIFWNRCQYLGRKEVYELYKESNMMMESVCRLAERLWFQIVVLVDNDGPVTRCGYEVLQMMCESSDEISNGEEMRMVRDELISSLSRGECSPMVKAFFRDEIDNHPQHPHHRISYSTEWFDGSRCNVCSCHIPNSDWWSHLRWRCVCDACDWEMCRSCGVVYAKQQVQHLMLAKDN